MHNFFFILFFLIAPFFQASAENTIKIGYVAPLTGEVAAFGIDGQRAALMAIEELNNQGFLAGKKFSLVSEDGRCEGKNAAMATSKLIRVDKVQAILYGGCSSEVLASAPIAEREEVLALASAAESADITSAGDYIFRISPNTALGGKDLAQWIHSKNFKKVAIISENSDYALSMKDHSIKHLEAIKVQVVSDVTYNPSDNDFRALLQKMRQKAPEVIIINPQTGLKAGLIVKQLRELNWSIPIFGNYSFNLLDAPQAAGGLEVLNGIHYLDYPVVKTPAGKKLMAQFIKKYGKPNSDFSVATAYDSIKIFAAAIKAVGYEGEAIKNHLYRIPKYKGIAFEYHFDDFGDAVGLNYSRKHILDNKIIELER